MYNTYVPYFSSFSTCKDSRSQPNHDLWEIQGPLPEFFPMKSPIAQPSALVSEAFASQLLDRWIRFSKDTT